MPGRRILVHHQRQLAAEVFGVQHPQDVLAVLRRGQQDLRAVTGKLQAHHPLGRDVQRIDQPQPRHVRLLVGVTSAAGGGVAVQLQRDVPQAEALRRPVRLGVCIGGEAYRGQKALVQPHGERREPVLRVERGVAVQAHVVVRVVVKGGFHPVRFAHGDAQLVEGGERVIVVGVQVVPQQLVHIVPVPGQIQGIGVVEVPHAYPLRVVPTVQLTALLRGLRARHQMPDHGVLRLHHQCDVPPVVVAAVVDILPPVVVVEPPVVRAARHTVDGVPCVAAHVVLRVPAQPGAVLDGGVEAQSLRRRYVAPRGLDGDGQGGGGAVQP